MPKMHQNTFGGWADPLGSLIAPDPLAAIEGVLPLSGGREGKGREKEGRGGERRGRGRKQRGEREGREGMCPLTLSPGSSERCFELALVSAVKNLSVQV